MGDNQINFRIGSVFSGEGFTKADNAVKKLARTTNGASGDLKNIAKSIGGASSAFGSAADMAGKFAGAIGRGGIMGAAMAAASIGIEKLVSWYSEFKRTAHEAALAAHNIAVEFTTLEFQHKRYADRLAGYKKLQDEETRAEEKAKKEAKEAADARKRGLAEAWSKADKYYATLTAIEQEELKAAAAGKTGNDALQARIKLMATAANADVAKARRGLSAARETGGDTRMAERELELALKKRETAKAEAKALLDAAKKKREEEEAEKDATIMAAEREAYLESEKEKKRKAAEEAITKIREDGEKRSKEIEDKIAAARKEAAQLEENAARARGVSFGDWMRGERDLDRARRTEEGNAAKRMGGVDREIDRLTKMNPKAMTKWQKDRLAKLLEWKADQNPNNNPALKKVADLEKERDALAKKRTELLASIDKSMKALGL